MDKMKELKARHLAEKEALSAQHEEELKGAKLEDVKSKHEEQLKKLQDKHAEELKKLGVEEGAEEEKKLDAADGDGEKEKLAAEETAETEKKESEAMKAKMSAAKPQLIKLAKGITSGMKTSRLTARKQMISAKLSGLRASAKMTPAEQKKLNLEDLAKQSDAELSAFFKGFEVRENVIDPRVHGTTKALSLASLSRLTEKSRLTRLEAEARHDMGMDMDEEHKKSLEEAKPSVAIEKEKMANDPQSSDLAMKKLEEMLSSYDQRDAVMAHVKSMMAPKELAEVAPEQAESAEKQMSALVNDFNRLQTEFSDLVNLIGDLTGVEKSELTE